MSKDARAGIAVLATVGTILLMGQAAPVPEVVEAHPFVLIDSSGQVRGELSRGAAGDVPGLRLYESGSRKSLI